MDLSVKFIIDPKDLEYIKAAQQRITLAKPVNSENPSVIWLSIDPFQSTDVQWTEQYGIYASTTTITEGASITKLSETTPFPAQDGAYYTLSAATTFNGPFPGGGVSRGSFGAQNDVPHSAYPTLTFGLTQNAVVNQRPSERKPLSATPVLATQFVSMTPFTIVYAWLQSQFSSETIITRITGKRSKITLGGSVTSVTMKYSPELGMFVPSTDQGKLMVKDVSSKAMLSPGIKQLTAEVELIVPED
jgi:hypothetical protein